MSTSPSPTSRREQTLRPWSIVLHGALTAGLLALGLGMAPARARRASPGLDTAVPVAGVREDLAVARRALEAARPSLELPADGPRPSAAVTREAVARIDDLVPVQDSRPADLDRFADRLVALRERNARQQLVAYYEMVTRPLLPGYDDAALERVTLALADYAESMKAIPWGRFHLMEEDAEASWRDYLARRDGLVREQLARDLTPEQVDLLAERFCVRVPAPGEPLPSPRLSGTEGDER